MDDYRTFLSQKLKRVLCALCQDDLQTLEAEQADHDQSFLDNFLSEMAENDFEHSKDESVRESLLQLSEQYGDEDLVMECQLQLLRSYGALLTRNENELLQAMSEALTAATFFLQNRGALERVFNAAVAIRSDDDFELGRLCLRRAKGLLEQGNDRVAREWANRIPREKMGPYRPHVDSLMRRLEASPWRRWVAWLRGVFR